MKISKIKYRVCNWRREISNKNEMGDQIRVYEFLMKRLKACKGKVTRDPVFQTTYAAFYAFGAARPTPAWKNKYFRVMETWYARKKTITKHSIKDILTQLPRITRKNTRGGIPFSFATKLLHSIEPTLPLFDSKIQYVFNLKTGDEINGRTMTYADLCDKYNEIIDKPHKDKKIQMAIISFKRYFKTKIEDTKVIDFIIWSIAANSE